MMKKSSIVILVLAAIIIGSVFLPWIRVSLNGVSETATGMSSDADVLGKIVIGLAIIAIIASFIPKATISKLLIALQGLLGTALIGLNMKNASGLERVSFEYGIYIELLAFILLLIIPFFFSKIDKKN